MSSQKQINANRQNAQNSTGPRTTKGKEKASQNSVKHGLSARYDVIGSESQADFDLHRQKILDELSPAGPMESMLAERIVSLSWRLERTVRIQNQVFDAKIFNTKNNPLTKLAQAVLSKHLKGGQPESPPELELGQLAIKDFADCRILDRLLMYERRMENSLYKTMLELQRLRLARNLETAAAANNEPRTGNFEQNVQNEPNFKDMEMHSTQVHKSDYQQLLNFSRPKKRTQTNPMSTNAEK